MESEATQNRTTDDVQAEIVQARQEQESTREELRTLRSEQSRAVGGLAGLVTALLARLLMTVTGLAVVGISLVFAFFDEDQVHMTDDYAAIVAGTTLGAFVLSWFEVHYILKRMEKTATSSDLEYRDKRRDLVAWLRILVGWLTVWLAQALSIFLVALWASIEHHGPARWVVWYSLLTVGGSVLMLFSTGMRRLMEASFEVTSLALRDHADEPSGEVETEQT
ncbi:hypothetical protein ABZS53_15160 [Streptomyces sp. NPDC005499]|uniref:hypothetical protein n=1 Tax=Streptomyces sp. NPDC005499 TaxID=3154883 RepID=UPI0033ABAA36